jgi:dCMP deaminase
MQREPEFWYKWFMGLAQYVSTASKDPSTQAGAVIIQPDRSMVSTGYNGFPRHMSDAEELYANRAEKYSRVVHAEVNALIAAGRPLQGCVLFTYPFAPCDRCCVQMLQAGITLFVFPEPTEDALSRWAVEFQKTKQYIHECGAKYIELAR